MATSAKFRKKVPACPVRRNKGRKWRRFRETFFGQSPTNRLCADCLQRGITVAARIVDHIIPIALKPELEFELSNLQGLCVECSDRKTARENSGGRQAR
jgi:5-methylcytosine-specific restriction protein A